MYVDKNIPPPPSKYDRTRSLNFKNIELEVYEALKEINDSVEVEITRLHSSFGVKLRRIAFQKKEGKFFMTKKTGKNKIRVWLIGMK